MSKELSVQGLGEAVRDKVRGAIFSSIPDEAIQSLIEKEFSDLNTAKYHNDKSPLKQIIYDEIRKQAGERIKLKVTDYLEKTFQANEKELVDAAISEIAKVFMQSMANDFARAAVRDLTQNLRQSGYNFNGSY